MDEFKNIAPKLSKIKKENPFKVPDRYFDDFSSRLQEKIKQESVGKKPNPVIRILKPMLAIAASIAVIFMLVYWPLNKSNNTQIATMENTFHDYNMENAIIGIMEDLDDNSLIAIFEGDIEEDAFSDEALIGYLAANLSDYDIYIEQQKNN